MNEIDLTNIRERAKSFEKKIKKQLSQRDEKFKQHSIQVENENAVRAAFMSNFQQEVVSAISPIYERLKNALSSQFLEFAMETHERSEYYEDSSTQPIKPYVVLALDINNHSVLDPFEFAPFLYIEGISDLQLVNMYTLNQKREELLDIEGYDDKTPDFSFSIAEIPVDRIKDKILKYVYQELQYLEQHVTVVMDYELPDVDVFIERP